MVEIVTTIHDPFVDVALHVVKTKSIRGERADLGGINVAIEAFRQRPLRPILECLFKSPVGDVAISAEVQFKFR
jgi:hypothetical protein